MLGKGTATAIGLSDYAVLAQTLGCDPAVLEAIAEVESNGFGWFRDGRIKILFEKHVFYRQLTKAGNIPGRDRAVRLGVARENWISPANGGYKDQDTADQRYGLLELAMTIDAELAMRSISIGRFQIMGFNHETCGYTSAVAMFDAFCESEANQLKAFGRFLVNKNLTQALRNADFDDIETGYNGGGQKGAYAVKMRAEYDRLKKIAGRYSMPKKEAEEVVIATAPLPPLPEVSDPGRITYTEATSRKGFPWGWVIGGGVLLLLVLAAMFVRF